MTAVSFHAAALPPSTPPSPNGSLGFQPSNIAPSRTTPRPKVAPPQAPKPPNAPPGGGGLGALLLRGFAIGVGLSIGYSLPDWLRSATGGSQTLVEGDGSQCDPQKVAANYLDNLKQDGVDQAVKAIPPKVFEWKTPNGYKLSVKQGWGKDGLMYTATLQGSNGQEKAIGPIKVQVNAKGTKVPLGELPFVVAGESFGRLNMALRVGATGLNEVEMAFTSNDGIVSTLKLKPQACGLDLTQSQLLRVNAGNPADARFWADIHLAQTAQKNGGSLKEGLHDLLTVIQPSANGVYRNHGSDVLGVLTKPLNALKNAGVDMRPLERFQEMAAATPRNSPEYRAARGAASKWMTQALGKAIDQGKIAPLNLSNAYKINYGLASVVDAQGPLPPTMRVQKDSKSKIGPQADRAIKTNWRELQQVAGGSGYVLTQLADGRLFAVGLKPDKQSQDALLGQLAGALKVKKEQLVWRSESHTVNGVKAKGIAIEPRVYVR